MKIRRNSWHFKLAMFHTPYSIPTDLCSYVRSMIASVFAMFVIALLSIFCVAIIEVALMLLLNPILTGVGYYLVGPNALCRDFLWSAVVGSTPRVCEDPSVYTFWTPFTIASFLIWVGALIYKVAPPVRKGLKSVETVQLASAYVSAKKKKICPTIEYI